MCEENMIDSIGHEIKVIDHVMQRSMFRFASDSGIDKVTIMHGWIMKYLQENKDKDIFQKDIESFFAISRSTVTNILKLMEKKGYILRVSVDTDARLKKITLTEKGSEVNTLIKQAVMENEKRLNSVLSAEERETFLYLIRKLRVGLENSCIKRKEQ